MAKIKVQNTEVTIITYDNKDYISLTDMVTAVNDGLLAGEGNYTTQVGVYTLTCTRADNVATLTFENTLAATPEPQATPDGADEMPEDEGGNEEDESMAG